jgi:hypothetical protein
MKSSLQLIKVQDPRRRRMKVRRKSKQYRNAAERLFIAGLEYQRKTWFDQPKSFRLPAPLYSYRPDFYVIEDQCFYEIVGTRQAYSYQRQRIEAFRETYPHLRLELVNLGAWKRGSQGPRISKVKENYQRRRFNASLLKLSQKKDLSCVGKELLAWMFLLDCRTQTEFSRKLGLSKEVVNSILRNVLPGHEFILEVRHRAHALLNGGEEIS